ncbi:unnamed protein product [Spodoptera littoralis]|uniref:Uncharacterized protein n=1 Tax=Spodoptera littoralis TaxID=7109 RepID=A0A9P0N0H0_SPOLI|nr:unnamed protein product [Spodoptera littoralis]CAH1640101.1 unnamed protein product [Spodoptera littoralis]
MDNKLAANLEVMQSFLTSRMAAYEDKLEKVSAAMPGSADLESLHLDYMEFKKFVLQAVANFKSQLELLMLGHDKHETAMRRKVLLVHGVPEHKNEQLREVVVDVLCNRMGLTELHKGNIHVCHRLGSSSRSPRPILVRFYTTEHRHLVWDNKKSLKGTGITISEFLTQLRHRSFIAARKHFGQTNCWTVEGRIVIIAPDKSRHKIESMAQLQELVVRFPPVSSGPDIPVAVGPGSPSCTTTDLETKIPRKARRRNNN